MLLPFQSLQHSCQISLFPKHLCAFSLNRKSAHNTNRCTPAQWNALQLPCHVHKFKCLHAATPKFGWTFTAYFQHSTLSTNSPRRCVKAQSIVVSRPSTMKCAAASLLDPIKSRNKTSLRLVTRSMSVDRRVRLIRVPSAADALKKCALAGSTRSQRRLNFENCSATMHPIGPQHALRI